MDFSLWSSRKGIRLTNDDLDDYHGHSLYTNFPKVYHYHITDELPWINGMVFMELLVT